jgi:excisionase family DNA binding protein
MPDLMTLDEVAELLRTPPATLRYWRHVGKGPRSLKLGRRILYDRSDVEAFIAELRGKQLTDPHPPRDRSAGNKVDRRGNG